MREKATFLLFWCIVYQTEVLHHSVPQSQTLRFITVFQLAALKLTFWSTSFHKKESCKLFKQHMRLRICVAHLQWIRLLHKLCPEAASKSILDVRRFVFPSILIKTVTNCQSCSLCVHSMWICSRIYHIMATTLWSHSHVMGTSDSMGTKNQVPIRETLSNKYRRRCEGTCVVYNVGTLDMFIRTNPNSYRKNCNVKANYQ